MILKRFVFIFVNLSFPNMWRVIHVFRDVLFSPFIWLDMILFFQHTIPLIQISHLFFLSVTAYVILKIIKMNSVCLEYTSEWFTAFDSDIQVFNLGIKLFYKLKSFSSRQSHLSLLYTRAARQLRISVIFNYQRKRIECKKYVSYENPHVYRCVSAHSWQPVSWNCDYTWNSFFWSMGEILPSRQNPVYKFQMLFYLWLAR